MPVMTASNIERRKTTRYETTLDVDIVAVSGKARSKSSSEQRFQSINISQLGICVLFEDMSIDGIHIWGDSMHHHRNTLRMRVHMPWDGDGSCLSVKGQVRYFEKVIHRGKTVNRVYIEFVDLKQVDQLVVTRTIEKLDWFLNR